MGNLTNFIVDHGGPYRSESAGISVLQTSADGICFVIDEGTVSRTFAEIARLVHCKDVHHIIAHLVGCAECDCLDLRKLFGGELRPCVGDVVYRLISAEIILNFFVLVLKLGFVGVAFALVIQRVETAAGCILECDLAGNGPPFRVPLPALTRGSTSGVHLVYVRAVITAYRGILRVGHINADIHISFPRRAGVQTGLRNFRPCHIGDFKRTFAVDIGGINNLEINVYLSAFSS